MSVQRRRFTVYKFILINEWQLFWTFKVHPESKEDIVPILYVPAYSSTLSLQMFGLMPFTVPQLQNKINCIIKLFRSYLLMLNCYKCKPWVGCWTWYKLWMIVLLVLELPRDFFFFFFFHDSCSNLRSTVFTALPELQLRRRTWLTFWKESMTSRAFSKCMYFMLRYR